MIPLTLREGGKRGHLILRGSPSRQKMVPREPAFSVAPSRFLWCWGSRGSIHYISRKTPGLCLWTPLATYMQKCFLDSPGGRPCSATARPEPAGFPTCEILYPLSGDDQ